MRTVINIHKEVEEVENPRPRPWGQDRRLEFIEFRLLWDGKINRGEVAEYFNVSIQQISLDFARYMFLAKDNMEYDRREKIYRTTKQFTPLFIAPDTQTYLNELSGLTTGTISPSLSFMGARPPCDVVTLPVRRVRTDVLLPILWAMRDGTEIDTTYQSMRSPDPTRQWIAPHSLAFDGTRWHARAWCGRSSRFRDFVLTRFQQIHGHRSTSVNPQDDVEWQTFFVVEIEPNPILTISQRDAVINDFGMVDGRLSKTIRCALVLYFVRHLRIDEAEEAQPIVWANRSQFEEVEAQQTRTAKGAPYA
jgi:predicted DNA-binding transcriptional regulator YafY